MCNTWILAAGSKKNFFYNWKPQNTHVKGVYNNHYLCIEQAQWIIQTLWKLDEKVNTIDRESLSPYICLC